MNVTEECRKARRRVLREQGQPVYVQPGKRERKVLAKIKARGGYSHAQLVRDFKKGHTLAQRLYALFSGIRA